MFDFVESIGLQLLEGDIKILHLLFKYIPNFSQILNKIFVSPNSWNCLQFKVNKLKILFVIVASIKNI